jgi:iron complex outermembrane recepter protein
MAHQQNLRMSNIMKTRTFPAAFRLGRLSLAVSAAWLAPPVLADEIRLDPILVEAQSAERGLPAGAQVDLETIRRLLPASSDTASLLRDVPGISLYGAGGLSSLPSIRGLADDRVRVKVDGMDLISSCPNHMNPPLSYVGPSNVGLMMVFAGITPVSVGGDSLGGTIIVETRRPEFAARGEETLSKGELSGHYRSNNDAYGGSATATFATEALSLNYNGSWSQADNYTAGGDFKSTTATGRPGRDLPLDEVGSTAYETQDHALNLALQSGRSLFELGLGYQDMSEQLFPNQRMDMLDNEQTRVNLSWTGELDRGVIEARAYHEKVEHFMDFGPDKRFWYGSNSQPPAAPEIGSPCDPIRFMGDPEGTCAAGMPMYSESSTSGATLKTDIDLSVDALVRAGIEYQRYRLDDYWLPSGGNMGPGTFLNISNGQRDRWAAFGEWESQLTPSWLLLLGARYERVSTDTDDVQGYATAPPAMGNQLTEAAAFNALDREKTDNNVDLAALALYTHSATLDIELGAARKVRSPNLYQRYTWSTWPMAAIMNNTVGDGNGYVGDIDLKAESAYTVSTTFDWHAADGAWELIATPYFTLVEDYIDAVPVGGLADEQFNVLRYANQNARLYGIDVSGKVPLGNNALGAWEFSGVASYTVGKNRDSNEDLYNIMPLNARLSLGQKVGRWDNVVELVMVKSKDDVSGTRNEISTPGYALVNLRVAHTWKRLRIDFGVENLFDRLYSLPTGGAYLGQGSTMGINTVPWGIAVPGMGRSFYAGVTVTF